MGTRLRWWVWRSAGHRSVAGWSTPGMFDLIAALTASQRRRDVTGALAEIGVHHGRFLVAMLLAADRDEPALALDVFADQAANRDGSGHGDERRVHRNVRRWTGAHAARVQVVSADSTTWSGTDVRAAVGAVRLFHVDGGHTPDVVGSDLATARDSLVDGGIVLLDDVFNFEWPGVVGGLQAHLAGPDALVPVGIAFNKVVLTTPAGVTSTREDLRRLARRRVWRHKTSDLGGHPVEVVWPGSGVERLRLLLRGR